MVAYEYVLFATLSDGRLFVEVDRDIHGRASDETDEVHGMATSAGLDNLID